MHAAHAGLLLYSRVLMNKRRRTRDEALLREVLSTDADARERAESELMESVLRGRPTHVTVAVVEFVPADAESSADVEVCSVVEELAGSAAAYESMLAVLEGRPRSSTPNLGAKGHG